MPSLGKLDRAASVPLVALGVLLLVRTRGGSSGEPLELLSAVLGALAVVVGPPGGSSAVWTIDRLGVTALGTSAIVLLASAGRDQRHRAAMTLQPYAR